mmetsp:Transcript_110869/g.220509  ORF Transcript_110869/g.220509 Transcript_110869/m.220509 type:complete len:198 (-) Transcript_110869:113-706(-)
MFGIVAFALLGIERFLYGWIYHFPESFKAACRGPLKGLYHNAEGKYWLVAKHLGIVIKVFQFGIIGYDLLFRCSLTIAPMVRLCIGIALLLAGQALNSSTFNAIGAMGVYYGSQLGYEVPWYEGFPYNIGISDPQYWGVVLCIWGVYLITMTSDNILAAPYLVPWLETFWYVASMKLLEDKSRGGWVLRLLGLTARD